MVSQVAHRLPEVLLRCGAEDLRGRALVLGVLRTEQDAAAPNAVLGAVICLLALAGTIEGLLSASDGPAAVKFLVGGLSAVLLGLYFGNGWRYLRSGERSLPAEAGASSRRGPA